MIQFMEYFNTDLKKMILLYCWFADFGEDTGKPEEGQPEVCTRHAQLGVGLQGILPNCPPGQTIVVTDEGEKLKKKNN